MMLLSCATVWFSGLILVRTLQPTILTVFIVRNSPVFHWLHTKTHHESNSDSSIVLAETDFWTFYDVYNQTNALVVYVDLRYEACPLHVFQRRMLAYVTTFTRECPEPNGPDDFTIFRLHAGHLDLMAFVSDFFRSWWTMPNQTASFALLFDASGEEFTYKTNEQYEHDLLYDITVALINCSSTENLTSLAANTNVEDIVVIATGQCITSMLFAFSKLDLPNTRFRWLIYPTDSDDLQKFCIQYSYICDTIQPVLILSRHSIQVPVGSLQERLSGFITAVVGVFKSNLSEENRTLNIYLNQSNPDDGSCSLNCSLNCSFSCSDCCKPCRDLFQDSIQKVETLKYQIFPINHKTHHQDSEFKLYRLNSSANLYLGNWSHDSGLRLLQQAYTSKFTDTLLTVAVNVEPPFIFRNVSEPGSYYGYSIDVLTEISKTVGFTFTVRECDEGGYGVQEDGLWNGCIGNVVRGEADVILGALTVTAERDNVIDFTLPYYDFAGIQIMTRKQTSNINLFYYIDVFSTQAWLCLFSVVLLTSLLLWCFERVSRKHDKATESVKTSFTTTTGDKAPYPGGSVHYTGNALAYNNNTFVSKNQPRLETGTSDRHSATRESLGDNMWFVVGAVTMVGGGDPPKTVAGRVLLAGFWFFSIIIMSTFTANLAAFLTVSRMGDAISGLEDLLDQTEMKFSVVNRSSVMDYFKRMAVIERDFYERWKNMTLDKSESSHQDGMAVWEYPLGNKYGNIWSTIQDTGLVKSIDQGLDKVLNENFALITESPLIQYYSSQNCLLGAIGYQFSVRPYAIGLKEKSPYTGRFSEAILKLQKDRQLGSLRLKWWSTNSVTCAKDTGNTGLDLYSLSGTFFVAGVGVTTGLLTLILECVLAYFIRGRKSRDRCSRK